MNPSATMAVATTMGATGWRMDHAEMLSAIRAFPIDLIGQSLFGTVVSPPNYHL
jgi:hypothetical protein